MVRSYRCNFGMIFVVMTAASSGIAALRASMILIMHPISTLIGGNNETSLVLIL